ncbi:ricin-type beta-trefoil lectin domain protein [Streptomyces sp. NPDC048518]|uniref:ricin-type beta-trefoil lectin domain protein n=1 Tax=Streptomyces sp. NPDC048518 TaxID=3155029 RepID=UPI0033D04930
MRFTLKSAAAACTLAMCATLGTVSTEAHADAQAISFHLKNVTTGKCLKWNGRGKPVTQAKCKRANNQYWGFAGNQLVTLSDDLPGQGCMTAPTRREGRVTGRSCFAVEEQRRTSWWVSSEQIGDTTSVANPLFGHLRVTKAGKIVCGKMINGNRDRWKVRA